MLKRMLTYTDFNGQEQTELLFFNLTNPEMLTLSVSREGDLAAYVEKIIAAQDTAAALELVRDLILTSYGVKSEDGKRFVKTPELREEFSQSAAYAVLFSELMLDGEKQEAFINGITPPDWPEYRKKLEARLENIGKDQSADS